MARPVERVVKRTGEVVPFDPQKIEVAVYKATAAVGGHDRDLARRATRQVVEALGRLEPEERPPTVEEIQDRVERVLIERGAAEVAKAYIVYRHERAKMRDRTRRGQVEHIPYRAMWQALDWAVEHGCHTVGGLNAIVRSGRLGELVEAADRRYEAMLDGAAAAILERREELHFVIIAGPSCSGKTTTTHKLSRRLESAGVHVLPLSLDNYFYDLELHPKDERGDYDFETPEALDLALINEHLAALDAGETIEMPVYDFKTGRRRRETESFAPREGSLILLDTLHGLYAGLTESVPDAHEFRLYIETISQLKSDDGRYVRWADLRLLRRMVRDARSRGYDAERTILHWHYVRRSELKHIIPYQGSADYQVNGALPYELPVIKRRVLSRLERFLERRGDDAGHLDGAIRARRVRDLLASIEGVDDDSLVPDDSLLREFIGGSAYGVG